MSTVNPETIRAAREAAGWSIVQAAKELRAASPDPLPEADSLVRAWKRWEHGTAPSRYYRPLLVRLLGLDTGSGPRQDFPDLSGLWYAAWQSRHDRREVVGVQQVRCRQHGEVIRWQALDRGRPPGSDDSDVFGREDGGYLWRGELRMWDNRVLIGWYAADDGSVLSKGAVHLVMHPHGQQLTGRWTGLSYDGDHETGLGAMARTDTAVRALYNQLRAKEQ